MEEWRRKKIEEVYAKWEKKGRGNPTKSEHGTKSFVAPRPPRYSSGSSRMSRRKQQKSDIVLDQSPGFVPSLGVDLNALHAANNKKYFSISRCCQRCVPASRTKYYSETNSVSGLQNLLLIDIRKHSGFPWRFFPYVSYIYCTPNSTMADLRRDTLQSKRVRDAIEFCSNAAVENDGSTEYSQVVKSQEKRARSIVNSMSSGVYSALVKVIGWIVFHVFGQLFNGLYVQKKHIHMLREAQKKGVPMVFLPSHKSHMDYIIMTFVLFSMGINIPRIAAGDNLRLPIVSWIVTHLGGFFIKRKLDTAAGKDVLYRKCLHEYMERVLYSGDNMEFFIDGSRSRSGKHNSPKAGLLSVLVDSVKEGVVQDIIIVPVSISYDKLMERNFVRHELMGGNKKPETFMQAMRGAWSLLTKNIGSVSVNFAQPFSLQEYLSSAVVSPHSLMELSNVSRSRSILNLAEHTQRKLVTALSHHITYEFQNCSSLMAPSIVSFLMLNKYREGVKYSDLVEDYQWIEQMAVSRGRSIAFTGEASEAVHYALHYLGNLVVLEDGSSTSGAVLKNQVLKPYLSLPDVFELLHHANQVSPIFILEAVVACSLHSLLGDELLKGRVDNASVVEVSREELVEESLFLCKLLAREFVFATPCVDIWSTLMETVDSFVNSEMLKMPETVSGHSGGRRLPCPVIDSDESDNDTDVMLQVNTDGRTREHLQFLQRILDPFLEAYWMATISLVQLEEVDTEETVFLKQLQENLFDKMERGVLLRVESCSMDTLRNAVKSLVDMNVVKYRNTTKISIHDADYLMKIAESIVNFKS